MSTWEEYCNEYEKQQEHRPTAPEGARLAWAHHEYIVLPREYTGIVHSTRTVESSQCDMMVSQGALTAEAVGAALYPATKYFGDLPVRVPIYLNPIGNYGETLL